MRTWAWALLALLSAGCAGDAAGAAFSGGSPSSLDTEVSEPELVTTEQADEQDDVDSDDSGLVASYVIGDGAMVSSYDINGGASAEVVLDVVEVNLDTLPPYTFPAPLHTPHALSANVMYLTFDDGPNPYATPQILDVLAKHDARATFFVQGIFISSYPAIMGRITDEGHTLGNHAWNHEDLRFLSKEKFDDVVGRANDLLGEHATACLRPPYAGYDEDVYRWGAEHGLRITMWNVDPKDWDGKSAQVIADHVVQRARPGAVVLLHDGGGDRRETVKAVDMILSRLADSGLRFEPLC